MDSLARTATGDLSGKEKVDLETYVQTIYLDRIAARASRRLLAMTEGQYEIARRKGEGSASSRGLEIDLIDHYPTSSGTSVRDVKSASGGEGFMASLALALGLSEEIQIFAGGVDIDTLYIDEGFGSLDELSLDRVYKALVALAEGDEGSDKLIGIVSHVPELEAKIRDKRINIKKQTSGGSIPEIEVS